jgi:uncharacterized protein YndB with AHSA1/START domain
MTFTRTAEVDIDAPVATVFGYVADLTKHPEWADQSMTMEHVGGPTAGPGATYRSHVVVDLPVGHHGEDATVVVRDVRAPTHVEYEATDSMGTYRWTIDLTDDGGRTHVTQSCERLAAPGWVKVVQPTMWRAMGRRQVASGLTHLRDRVEHATGA